jgi:hypothetical protein
MTLRKVLGSVLTGAALLLLSVGASQAAIVKIDFFSPGGSYFTSPQTLTPGNGFTLEDEMNVLDPDGSVSVSVTQVDDDGELLGGLITFTMPSSSSLSPTTASVKSGQDVFALSNFVGTGNVYTTSFSGLTKGASNVSVQVVPIPAALPLMLGGLAGLGLIARRKKDV